MNWSKAGLESNEENIEISYRKESKADKARHLIYAGSFERKWAKYHALSERQIAAEGAEIIALLSDNSADVAADTRAVEVLAGLRSNQEGTAHLREDPDFDEDMRDDSELLDDEEILSLVDEFLWQELEHM